MGTVPHHPCWAVACRSSRPPARLQDVIGLLPENTPLPASDKMTYLLARLEVPTCLPVYTYVYMQPPGCSALLQGVLVGAAVWVVCMCWLALLSAAVGCCCLGRVHVYVWRRCLHRSG